MKSVPSGGVCMTLMACVLPVQAAVQISEQRERYVVTGATASELRSDINAKRPVASDGRRFDGHTRWHVSWRYRYRKTANHCAIAAVNTDLKVIITLPHWLNESGADSATRRHWSRYVAALEQHEQGHRGHGVAAANEVDRAITALAPAGDCDTLGATANALGKRILEKYNQLDLDYDRDTRHGATQGARFP